VNRTSASVQTPGKVSRQEAPAKERTSWQPPLPKPILYANDSREADEAKALLERYGIDFEVRETRDPLIALHWKHHPYTDICGIADFIIFAGRLNSGKATGVTRPSRARWFPCALAKRPPAQIILPSGAAR
jgi:hypothetical protein